MMLAGPTGAATGSSGGQSIEFAMQHSPTLLPHHKSANNVGSLFL